MNTRTVTGLVLILIGLLSAGCGSIPIPTNIPIPSDLPEFPTFEPPQDGGDPTSPPPEDGNAQPTQEGSIPVTGSGDDTDGSMMLLYGLLALLGVVVLFGFMALLRKPDAPYSESSTGRRGRDE